MSWTNAAEKRKHVRGDVYSKIFAFLGKHKIIGSFTDNISEGGLRARFEEKIPIATEIKLELYLTEDPIICKARVVWVKKVTDKNTPSKEVFETGIQFLSD